MAKSSPDVDVLVLGDHPATYLSAALLRQKTKLRVVHTTIPGNGEADRLVIINPQFFTLHPLLEPLKRKLDLVAVYGLQFLSDDPAVQSEYRSKAALSYVAWKLPMYCMFFIRPERRWVRTARTSSSTLPTGPAKSPA